jgi:hypothetical protein
MTATIHTFPDTRRRAALDALDRLTAGDLHPGDASIIRSGIHALDYLRHPSGSAVGVIRDALLTLARARHDLRESTVDLARLRRELCPEVKAGCPRWRALCEAADAVQCADTDLERFRLWYCATDLHGEIDDRRDEWEARLDLAVKVVIGGLR